MTKRVRYKTYGAVCLIGLLLLGMIGLILVVT
jgi:hypothetical protein